jgi:alpha-aminoadipic semialdehyde synthase
MKIGIRKETQYPSERRAPLTPEHVKQLVSNNIEIVVEAAEQRVFTSEEYQKSGAQISAKLEECDIIFGVKEVPIADLIPNKPYVFFSHTIKGQSYNMPLLKAILDKNITLLDYELVKNNKGNRLIFFGNFAGFAGMINSLWLLGKRLDSENIQCWFSKIKQAKEYNTLSEAEEEIKIVSEEITKNGLPNEIVPLITGFSGYGNVSKGAQSIYNLLPTVEIKPNELDSFVKKGEFSNKVVYKVEFKEVDMYKHPSITEFSFDHFVKHPNEYESIFSQYLKNLTVLVNGIYWEDKFPKHVTKKFMKELYLTEEKQKLKVIADITCDIEGSVELTVKNTSSNDPAFVYEPTTGEIKMGVEGNGPVILAVDKLPAELPRESSQFFGTSLLPFVKKLTQTDFSLDFENLNIPEEFKKAIIAHKGNLTPSFTYLKKFL